MTNGYALKQEGMARVDDHAAEEWKREAIMAVYRTAIALPELTSDDVMRCINPDVRTHELRAMGPVMMRAAKFHWIVKADQPARNSERPSLHASPRTVWRSLLFK